MKLYAKRKVQVKGHKREFEKPYPLTALYQVAVKARQPVKLPGA